MASIPFPAAPQLGVFAFSRMNRNTTIVVSVIALHVAVLWAMQTGLLHRVAEAIVPASILVEIMAPPPAQAPPAVVEPQVLPTAKPVVRPAPAKTPVATPTPLPPPVAIAETATTPAPSAIAPASVAPATAPASTAAASPSPAPAPARIELPSSDADYLHNPKPPYPALSKRLGEQGKVLVRTLIGADGLAKEASIKQSSGFDRLDQAALATALKWRYVPGKRAGVPEAMWFNVPFTFVIE